MWLHCRRLSSTFPATSFVKNLKTTESDRTQLCVTGAYQGVISFAQPNNRFCRNLKIDHKDSSICRCYKAWTTFILIWALYSSFFTPLEFGFFRGLPENLFILDIAGQIAFLVDIVLTFFVAYRDSRTYRMVYRRSSIALRYYKL